MRVIVVLMLVLLAFHLFWVQVHIWLFQSPFPFTTFLSMFAQVVFMLFTPYQRIITFFTNKHNA
jgi:hypothetical protein